MLLALSVVSPVSLVPLASPVPQTKQTRDYLIVRNSEVVTRMIFFRKQHSENRMSLDRYDADVVETRRSEISAAAASASVQAPRQAGAVSERAKLHPSPTPQTQSTRHAINATDAVDAID